MTVKGSQLQIRVTSAQKLQLRRLAARAGLDVSAYVLSRALPEPRLRVDAAVRALADEQRRTAALAELADAINALGAEAFVDATTHIDTTRLSPLARNYVAAMVEEGAAAHGVTPPAWVRNVDPLDEPWFATSIKSLRSYLLRVSPVPYKRRNIFIDASPAARV